MDEILEYEKQLGEVQEALEAEDEDELRQLETELKDLIAELRSKLPKFAVNEEVSTKTMAGKILEIAGHKMYKVQPFNGQLQPEGDPVVLDESVLRSSPLTRNRIAHKVGRAGKTLQEPSPTALSTTDSASHAPRDDSSAVEKEPRDEFEESKAKWKKFASKSNGAKQARGTGRVAKQSLKIRPNSRNL